MVGIGSGAILMPAFAQRLIAMLGWRSTYMVIGLLVIVVSVPIVALFLKESPEESGLLPDDASVARSGAQKQNSEEGLSWREARHSAKFGSWSAQCFSSASASTGVCCILPPCSATRPIATANRAGHHCSGKLPNDRQSGVWVFAGSLLCPASGDEHIRRCPWGSFCCEQRLELRWFFSPCS